MPIKTLNKGTIIIGGIDNSDGNIYKFLTNTLQSYTLPHDFGIKDNLTSYAFAGANMISINLNNLWFIPSFCFQRANLKRIDARNVKYISENAFSECSAVEEINVENVCITQRNCFYGCRRLKSLNLPNLISTSTSAFHLCNDLESITLGENLLEMGSGAFWSCNHLKYINLGFSTPRNGYNFAYCSSLERIRFNAPNTGEIGSYNFAHCSNLEEIENDFLLNSAFYSNAFVSCHKLKKLYVPFCGGIASNTFLNCYSLSEITVGHAGIGSSAFANCSNLEKVILLTKSTVIPSLFNVNAFSNTPIMDSSYLGRFGSIYVPSTMVSAFRSATNWALVSDRITSLPSEYDSKYIYAYEFYSRSDLTEIPSERANFEVACDYAFYRCSNLNKNLENSNAKLIGHNAFFEIDFSNISLANCLYIFPSGFSGLNNKALRNLYLPKCLYLDNGIFLNRSSIHTYNLDECRIVDFRTQNQLSTLSLPKALSVAIFDVGYIGGLSSFNLPNVVSLAVHSGSLGGVRLSSICMSGVKIVSIATSRVQYVSFPDAIKVGFAGCTLLSSYFLPEVMFFSNYAFARTSIENATFNKVLEVTSSCFSNCLNLKKGQFLNALVIRSNAFISCPLLSCVMFKNAEIFEGNSIFYKCSSLESLYFLSCKVVSAYYSSNFNSTPITDSSYLGHYGSIYVPTHLVSEYQADSVWSYFSDRFVGLTDQEMQDIIDHWND